MILRRPSAVVAVAMLATVLSGCVGAPAPTTSPTPTPAFASEEEAFAAAEETYRAYTDAGNARRTDPLATPRPEDFLIESALETDLDTMRELEELGVKLVGDIGVRYIEPEGISPLRDEVKLVACLDYTAARVIDELGNDVTPPEREPVSPLIVTLELVAGEFYISNSLIGEAPTC